MPCDCARRGARPGDDNRFTNLFFLFSFSELLDIEAGPSQHCSAGEEIPTSRSPQERDGRQSYQAPGCVMVAPLRESAQRSSHSRALSLATIRQKCHWSCRHCPSVLGFREPGTLCVLAAATVSKDADGATEQERRRKNVALVCRLKGVASSCQLNMKLTQSGDDPNGIRSGHRGQAALPNQM